MENKQIESDDKKDLVFRGSNRDYPVILIKVAEGVLKVVYDSGGKATKETISQGLNITGGGLAKKIASTKRWGLISGIGTISVTPLGMDILFPDEDDHEGNKARNRAFLQVPIFKKISKRFGGETPSKEILFISVLVKEFKIPEKDAKTILNIYKEAVKLYLNIEEPLTGGAKVIEEISEEKFKQNLFDIIEGIIKLSFTIKSSFKKEEVKKSLSFIEKKAEEEKLISITSHINNILIDLEVIENENILQKLIPIKIEKLIPNLKKELGYDKDSIGKKIRRSFNNQGPSASRGDNPQP